MWLAFNKRTFACLVLAVLLSSSNISAQDAKGIVGALTTVNYAPVAEPQRVSIQGTGPVSISLRGYDANGDDLTFEIDTVPSFGSLSEFSQQAGTLVYTPSTQFSGLDRFTFKVGDGVAESVPATVIIAVDDFTIAAAPSSATISRGQSATFTITVSPRADTFENAITFSCSGLPDRSACSFNPASVTVGANPANTTLTITTTAGSAAPPLAWRPVPPGLPATVVGLLALVLLLLLASTCPVPRHRRTAALASMALLAVVAIFQLACAGADAPPPPPTQAGTPPGTYPVTVTASSGSLQRTTNVTLTVR